MEIKSLNYLTEHLQRLIKGQLWAKVILGIVLGIALGIVLNPENGYVSEGISEKAASWLDMPGQIFLRLVQMVMIPLIFASIITGIISNSSENLKSMGLRLLTYFMITTVVSITIGMVLSYVMKPGKYINELGGLPGGNSTSDLAKENVGSGSIPETIANLIPNNPLEAMITGEMLGVVIFTIIIGVAITQLPKRLFDPMIHFTEAIQKICMIVVSWAMQLVPFAVFGMMAALMARIGTEIISGLGYYILVVLIGLVLLLIFYLLVLRIFTDMSPWKFLKAVRGPQLLAFSTASSAAVMPLSMKTADNELNISSNISDFVIPVGASINMDGTALFQCVSAVFLAQAYGIDLSLIEIVLLSVTIVAASIGTPAIPGGGVIILASVLESAGIPTGGLIVIIGIDRILGMFRTAVNVTGDLTACVLFQKWFGPPVPSNEKTN
ncbi:dicarboxylate/amino acid:cation symporter [Crocinitomicaceae bacterium]|nr:dicarboxylate/amino acid:cation symporter [Crocinitomicaceae bacterium]